MVLMAYGAEVELYGKGRKTVASLYGNGSIAAQDHLLGQGEVISHIHLPAALPQEQAGYFRSIARARAEWPLVEAFVRFTQMDGSIRNAAVAIGGVAPVPLLLPAVAESLNGKPATDATLQAAAQLSNQGANPLPGTAYKLEMVNATVLETLQRALKGVWGGEG
jgi:xanthine dehydrogenase YagS FAD-binding subunit